MKNLNILKILSLIVILFLGFVFTDCKRDKEDPVITLEGNSYIKLPLNKDYVEPGYSADDDKDGNITGRVSVSDSIIPDTVGLYVITYSVKDGKDKRTTVKREVERYNQAETYSGYFKGAYIIPSPGTEPIEYIDTIHYSETVNYQIILSNFAGEAESFVVGTIEPLSVYGTEIRFADQGSFTFPTDDEERISTVSSKNPVMLNIYYELDGTPGQLVLTKLNDLY